MDHLVTRRLLCLVFLAMLGMAALVRGYAETLLDPTRPASAAVDAASDSGPAVPTYQLQSVLIGRGAGGRRIAVINGQTMRVGDHLSGLAGAAASVVLIKISDGAVLIRSGARLQTLSLFPVPVKHPGATVDVEHEE